MKIIESFPQRVREVETCWIPLSDGCRLAARLWLPEGAEKARVPVVFEYIPYRRRDFTRARDEPIHHYFAGHGYASLRVDIRGSGDSDGVADDEFLESEMEDAVQVIAWLAAQPWSSGSVGMFGKSWGGMNALMVAARRPPALKAILSVCSTDDRYLDTDHYLGGCLTDVQMIWGAMFLAYLRRPPDPDVVGERWRDMWQERLDNAVSPLENWFRHQRYDAFWKRGSVCEDWSAITCAVYLVGGWLDGFSNSIFRMVAGLECPRKALVGPWGHHYPHDGWPGPAIGFLQDAIRWWDCWLKGLDNGLMAEPLLRVWMQESSLPDPAAPERAGRWVAEHAWPSPSITTQAYALNPGRLDAKPAPETGATVRSPQTVGLAGPVWNYIEHQAADQRADDGGSLCFDSEPLCERLEILGAPVVVLELASDRPVALAALRLNDVAPDGASLFVTCGLLNLTRRDGHERPEPLEPGRRYRVRIALDEIAHSFAPGHRIRIAVSTSCWHRVWPPPGGAALTVYTGASSLELPLRPAQPADAELRPFDGPESARPMRRTTLRPGTRRSTISRDVSAGEVVVTHMIDNGVYRIDDHGLEVEEVVVDRFAIREDDPLAASSTSERIYAFGRGEWRIRLECRVAVTSTAHAFRVRSHLASFEGETRVDSKEWDTTFLRDLL